MSKLNKIKHYIDKYGWYRPMIYVKQKGIRNLVDRVIKGSDEKRYNIWAQKHQVTSEVLEKQKNVSFNKNPKISLIVACYNTPIHFLEEMIESVMNQSYEKWELCIADGSENSDVKSYIEGHYLDNKKIKYKYLNENKGISDNMNEAIKLSTGDYIGFFDHDDTLTLDALYEMVKTINAHDDAYFIYSDEDKIDETSQYFFYPNFKPDFNNGLLLSNNYICHFLVFKRELLDSVGLLRKEYDGAQDYDFVLRCMHYLKGKGMYHIPKILYHWRSHAGSTAGNAESKTWAFDAGVKSLEDYYRQEDIDAKVMNGVVPGFYKTKYVTRGEPLISCILIGHNLYKHNVLSMLENQTYKNYEIIIVTDHDIQCDHAKIIRSHHKNKFIMANEGAKHASGDYLLFLEDSTQIESNDYIEQLLGAAQFDDVGCAGSRIYSKHDAIRHAGVVTGFNHSVGCVFEDYPKEGLGYNGYIQIMRDYSAVVMNGMMVKKSIFDEAEGFNEQLKTTADVDFCLRVRGRCVYVPDAKLKDDQYYYHNVTNKEKNHYKNKDKDPNYNPHLSLKKHHDFQLDEHQ